MKRILKSSAVPPQLEQYIQSIALGSSQDDWNVFCDCSKAKREVQKQLYADQKGLCAYCEIDIKPQIVCDEESSLETADFRVEHFHPQSDKSTRSPNHCSWGLDWSNMLACCSGGDDRALSVSGRYCEIRNRHCDAAKKGKILDGIILNPLADIPSFPPLFDEKTSGENADETIFIANKENCEKVNSNCYSKAKESIRHLKLNCTVLARFRHAALRRINQRIQEIMKSGATKDEAIDYVMCEVYDNTSPTWPPFFTTIRAHFGIVAEKRLKAINYQG